MRNEIDTVGVFVPTYFTNRKDLTLEEAYLLSLILDLARRREKIDYTNQAFSNVMKRDVRTISRWLVLLEKRGYIETIGKAQNRVILITKKTNGIKKQFYNDRGNE